jgi:ABC-type glycerol-3-phosphate transport system permease component
VGYAAVLTNGNFPGYFLNSLIVTVASLFFVLLFGPWRPLPCRNTASAATC